MLSLSRGTGFPCSRSLGHTRIIPGSFVRPYQQTRQQVVHGSFSPFSHLQSWPLEEWRAGDVPPLPWYHLKADESLNFIWVKVVARKGQRAAATSSYASLGGENRKGEDVLPLDWHLFQHLQNICIYVLNPNAETPIKDRTKPECLWGRAFCINPADFLFYLFFTANELSLAFFKGHLFFFFNYCAGKMLLSFICFVCVHFLSPGFTSYWKMVLDHLWVGNFILLVRCMWKRHFFNSLDTQFIIFIGCSAPFL